MEMALRGNVSACWCALLFLVLFIFPACSAVTRRSYTREELLDIRATIPADFMPTFMATSVELLDILVKGVLTVTQAVKRRRRGTRAGSRVRLRKQGHRTPLPGIFLFNVRSLGSNMAELQLLVGKRKSLSSSSVLCFTETCGLIPDSALQLDGFRLFRADRDADSGETEGGGICFYINFDWCTNVKVIHQHCSAELQTFFIKCKPFYSPRQFKTFILAGVYIPPEANVEEAQRLLSEQIVCVEWTNRYSLVVVLGTFNQGNLSHSLPKYTQFIKCPTREENIVDHCYTTVNNAYHAVPRAALDQLVMVHLIPAYKQKFKRQARSEDVSGDAMGSPV